MAERLEDFVALYPVHPSSVRTFERVTLVEKRRVLSTLSHAMAALLEAEVPTEAPGLICYDSYRSELDDDASNGSIPEVALVLDRTHVLRSKLQSALPQKEDVPVALRIVDALAVHRLTTEDIDVPIGLTVDELRDDLCLIPEGVPELEAGFIGTTLESVVAEIVKAVSGQFLSRNDDNGQLFLDVRKDIDYDQLIQERADSLDDQRLDDAYFRALEEVLEQRDTPYVASYRIWSYELPWKTKNVTRPGYLFMGAPNERSTAQPPRDFYIYFLQPYDEPNFADQELADETFVRLASPDEEFTAALRRYAGADALAGSSTEQHRLVYEQKRQQALQTMVVWLRHNMANAMTVTYRGDTKALGTWLQQIPGAKTSVKAQIDAIAARALEPHFDERYPGYPAFSAEITKQSFDGTVQAAISQVATRRPTALGTKVLTSLGLADMNGQIVTDGEFAKDCSQRSTAPAARHSTVRNADRTGSGSAHVGAVAPRAIVARCRRCRALPRRTARARVPDGASGRARTGSPDEDVARRACAANTCRASQGTPNRRPARCRRPAGRRPRRDTGLRRD